jgi:hypothetical protein
MRRQLALLFFVLPLLAETPPPATETVAGNVTIPLQTFEGLRRTNDRPSATVIDTILLAGGFRDRSLTITFSGRSTGLRPQVRAMDQTSDATISACSGNAILLRNGKGTFDLLPLADTFDARCELRISGSDRLQMHVTSAVLAVRSTVADAELVSGDENDAGARDYKLVRHVTGPGEVLAATATGRYLITLLPDATRFRYAIDVHNPNRTTSSLELVLQSQEHLQQIDSAAPYEVNGERYVFSIPPGDSTITLSGELRGAVFTAPVRASLQYLVIESHPLLRPSVRTPAKRISLGETGVTPTYRGAVAFEIGTERIGWQTTRLQAMHSTGYAVNQVAHTIFVPVDGPLLGESTFVVRNEGAPELVLPQQPEPTYVSIGDDAVLMTKNAAGQLTVPLSQGEQQVLVQHRQTLGRGFGVAGGWIAVPQLSVPATETRVRLAYPSEWVPLYESFAGHAHLWSPSAGDVFLFLVLALWIERLLAWLRVSAVRRFPIALLTALAAAIVMTFLMLVVLAFGALTVTWIITRPPRERIGLGVLFALVAIAGVMFMSISRPNARYKYEPASSDEAMTTDTTAARDVVTDTAAPPRAETPAASPAYQGLPAKFTLPYGDRATTFSQQLLRIDRPQRALVLAMSAALANWIGAAIALLALALLWRQRRHIIDALRGRFASGAAGFSPPVDPVD